MNSLLSEKYFVKENGAGKYALFSKDNPSKPISKWWKAVSFPNEEEYYIALRGGGKKALFHLDNPFKPVSKWFKWIRYIKQGYYSVVVDTKTIIENILNGNGENIGRQAIFHVDNPKEPASEWFSWIEYPDINGYYRVTREGINNLQANFHVDNPLEPISKWWMSVTTPNEQGYYTAHRKDGKEALFNVNNPLPISRWWISVTTPNEQGYYTAHRKDGKLISFHIDDSDNPVEK